MSKPCSSTLMLTIWHKKTRCFGFSIFFEFYAHILESWSNPRFDKDLNKFKTWKRKGKLVSLLISHSNMKILGGFWNFHVWNPKPLLFKLDFIRQSLGIGVDTWFVWFEYVQTLLMHQLECLLYDIRRLRTFVFHFSAFFEFCAHLNLLVKS